MPFTQFLKTEAFYFLTEDLRAEPTQEPQTKKKSLLKINSDGTVRRGE